KVDGEPTATDVVFVPASDFADVTKATPDEIVSAINRRSTKVMAALTSDKKLKLTSTGQVASLAKGFTRLDVTAEPKLGLAGGPVDAAVDKITANGCRLAKADDFVPGEAILVSDGANKVNTKVLRVNPDTDAIEWIPPVANPANFDALKTTVKKLEFDVTVF